MEKIQTVPTQITNTLSLNGKEIAIYHENLTFHSYEVRQPHVGAKLIDDLAQNHKQELVSQKYAFAYQDRSDQELHHPSRPQDSKHQAWAQ